MSQIVVATIGSFGDLHPKIAIALELRRRGHSIIFATHQAYQQKIEALGLAFHRIRPDITALNDPQEMALMMDLVKGTEYVLKDWICANLRETYADLTICAAGADLIIAGEGVVAARLVAEKLAIPWTSVVLQPLAFLSSYEPVVLPIFPSLSKLNIPSLLPQIGIRQLSKWMTHSFAKPIHQLRQALDLPPLKGNPFIDDKYSPSLVLAMFSSLFARPQPDWPKQTVQTGFAFFDGSTHRAVALPHNLQDFLAAGEPPIIFTLGSAAVVAPGNFYQESIRASQRLSRRALLLIGKNAPPKNLPTDMIAIDYLPYSQVFPTACAIVHQGGAGTTAQALKAGRPTLVVPYSHDQPDNAARIEKLGTSLTIPRQQYSASRAEKALKELLDNPRYAQKAAEIGHVLQSENGAIAACDAIEKQLACSNLAHQSAYPSNSKSTTIGK